MSTYLRISHGIGRGRETYGYAIVTVTDESTGKRYSCKGGGYDMIGTSFAQWLEDTHAAELAAWWPALGFEDATVTRKQVAGFYGAFVYPDGTVHLDGGCGIESMMRVAKAIGLRLERTYKRTGPNRGETTGWLVEEADVSSS